MIVADQQVVNVMFHARRHRKIKNGKTERWRMELIRYKYNNMYRPGNIYKRYSAFNLDNNIQQENTFVLIKRKKPDNLIRFFISILDYHLAIIGIFYKGYFGIILLELSF